MASAHQQHGGSATESETPWYSSIASWFGENFSTNFTLPNPFSDSDLGSHPGSDADDSDQQIPTPPPLDSEGCCPRLNYAAIGDSSSRVFPVWANEFISNCSSAITGSFAQPTPERIEQIKQTVRRAVHLAIWIGITEPCRDIEPLFSGFLTISDVESLFLLFNQWGIPAEYLQSVAGKAVSYIIIGILCFGNLISDVTAIDVGGDTNGLIESMFGEFGKEKKKEKDTSKTTDGAAPQVEAAPQSPASFLQGVYNKLNENATWKNFVFGLVFFSAVAFSFPGGAAADGITIADLDKRAKMVEGVKRALNTDLTALFTVWGVAYYMLFTYGATKEGVDAFVDYLKNPSEINEDARERLYRYINTILSTLANILYRAISFAFIVQVALTRAVGFESNDPFVLFAMQISALATAVQVLFSYPLKMSKIILSHNSTLVTDKEYESAKVSPSYIANTLVTTTQSLALGTFVHRFSPDSVKWILAAGIAIAHQIVIMISRYQVNKYSQAIESLPKDLIGIRSKADKEMRDFVNKINECVKLGLQLQETMNTTHRLIEAHVTQARVVVPTVLGAHTKLNELLNLRRAVKDDNSDDSLKQYIDGLIAYSWESKYPTFSGKENKEKKSWIDALLASNFSSQTVASAKEFEALFVEKIITNKSLHPGVLLLLEIQALRAEKKSVAELKQAYKEALAFYAEFKQIEPPAPPAKIENSKDFFSKIVAEENGQFNTPGLKKFANVINFMARTSRFIGFPDFVTVLGLLFPSFREVVSEKFVTAAIVLFLGTKVFENDLARFQAQFDEGWPNTRARYYLHRVKDEMGKSCWANPFSSGVAAFFGGNDFDDDVVDQAMKTIERTQQRTGDVENQRAVPGLFGRRVLTAEAEHQREAIGLPTKLPYQRQTTFALDQDVKGWLSQLTAELSPKPEGSLLTLPGSGDSVGSHTPTQETVQKPLSPVPAEPILSASQHTLTPPPSASRPLPVTQEQLSSTELTTGRGNQRTKSKGAMAPRPT